MAVSKSGIQAHINNEGKALTNVRATRNNKPTACIALMRCPMSFLQTLSACSVPGTTLAMIAFKPDNDNNKGLIRKHGIEPFWCDDARARGSSTHTDARNVTKLLLSSEQVVLDTLNDYVRQLLGALGYQRRQASKKKKVVAKFYTVVPELLMRSQEKIHTHTYTVARQAGARADIMIPLQCGCFATLIVHRHGRVKHHLLI